MDESCDCLLCQKRKLHPELTPTPVVHDETERPTWPIGDDLPPLSPELQKQVDEAHAWIRGENLPPPLSMDRVELMQQIEEFAEFAAERLDAARSELASKTAAGFSTFIKEHSGKTLGELLDKSAADITLTTEPRYNFPLYMRDPLESGDPPRLPTDQAWTLREEAMEAVRTGDMSKLGQWSWTDNAYCRSTEIHIGFDDRRLIGAKMTRVQVEAADLMPLFHEVADKAAKEWSETHYNARVKLDPTTVDVFVVSPGAARERCIGCTLSVSHCCCERPTKADTAPVDCRACGRVLGSPEEFMAHECAAETKDA